MAELRQPKWQDQLYQYIKTLQNTPPSEAGDPIRAVRNAVVKQVPIDLSANVMDTLRLAWGSVKAQLDPMERLDNAMNLRETGRGMLKSVQEDPLAAGLSLAAMKAPETALGAYREWTPMATRAYLHHFYGGGEPLTYMPKKLRAYATEGAQSTWDSEVLRRQTAQDMRAQAARTKLLAKEIEERERRNMRLGGWPSEHERMLSTLRDYGWNGPTDPRTVAREYAELSGPAREITGPLGTGDAAYYRSQARMLKNDAAKAVAGIQEDAAANVANEMTGPMWKGEIPIFTRKAATETGYLGQPTQAPARSVYTRTQNLLSDFKAPTPEVLAGEQKASEALSNTLGKTFVTIDRSGKAIGLRDLYKFWPEAYGYRPSELTGSSILGDAVQEIASGSMPWNKPAPYQGRPVGNFWNFHLPRRAAIRFGTPYEIDIPLPSGVGAPNAFDRALPYVGVMSPAEYAAHAAQNPHDTPRLEGAGIIPDKSNAVDQLKAYILAATRNPTGF